MGDLMVLPSGSEVGPPSGDIEGGKLDGPDVLAGDADELADRRAVTEPALQGDLLRSAARAPFRFMTPHGLVFG
jgi:hypothetical protein